MIQTSIKMVTSSGADRAIATILLAFSADPVARWFYPEAHDYLTNLPRFVQAFAGKAFEYNSAYQIDGYSGAALWLPPEVHPDENALVALLQQTIAEKKPAKHLCLYRADGSLPSVRVRTRICP